MERRDGKIRRLRRGAMRKIPTANWPAKNVGVPRTIFRTARILIRALCVRIRSHLREVPLQRARCGRIDPFRTRINYCILNRREFLDADSPPTPHTARKCARVRAYT